MIAMIATIDWRLAFVQKWRHHKTKSMHAAMPCFIGTRTEMQEFTFVRFVANFGCIKMTLNGCLSKLLWSRISEKWSEWNTRNGSGTHTQRSRWFDSESPQNCSCRVDTFTTWHHWKDVKPWQLKNLFLLLSHVSESLESRRTNHAFLLICEKQFHWLRSSTDQTDQTNWTDWTNWTDQTDQITKLTKLTKLTELTKLSELTNQTELSESSKHFKHHTCSNCFSCLWTV